MMGDKNILTVKEEYYNQTIDFFYALMEVRRGIGLITAYYSEINNLQQRILKSNLENELKSIHFNRLKPLSSDFLYFIIPIIKKDKQKTYELAIDFNVINALNFGILNVDNTYYLNMFGRFFDDGFFETVIQVNNAIKQQQNLS